MAAAAQPKRATHSVHSGVTAGGHAAHDNVESSLRRASTAGQLEAVLALVEAGANPDGGTWSKLTPTEVEGNSGDWHYWRDRVCSHDPTPLHEAAIRGHVDVARALLEAGARRNPRASAASCRSLLLSSAADGDDDDDDDDDDGPGKEPTHEAGGYAPLHFAALVGQAEVVGVLADAGANVNILGGERAETPLHVATRRGHTTAMLALLQKRARVDALNGRNRTALYEATSVAAVQLLQVAGADLNGRTTRLAETPLGLLVSETTTARLKVEVDTSVAIVKILLRHGACASVPFDKRNQHEDLFESTWTPAADDPWTSKVSTPDSSTSGEKRFSFLHYSSDSSDSAEGSYPGLDECSRVREHTSPSSSKSTPTCRSPTPSCPRDVTVSLLPRAAKNGVAGIVEALLDTGLDPSEEDEAGETSLHHAAREGHLEALRLLLRAGADVDCCASQSVRTTPLSLACRHEHLDCVLELLRWGASLDARCPWSSDDDDDDDDDFRPGNSGAKGFTEGQERDTRPKRHAIRRAIRHECVWRRRGGVIVLLALINKKQQFRNAPPTCKGDDDDHATAAAPASPRAPRSSSRGDAAGVVVDLEDSFGNNDGDCSDTGRCVGRNRDDAKRSLEGVVDDCGSSGRGSGGGSRGIVNGMLVSRVAGAGVRRRGGKSVVAASPVGGKRRGEHPALASETTDDGDGDDDGLLVCALAGLMDLGWGDKDLFRNVVRYL